MYSIQVHVCTVYIITNVCTMYMCMFNISLKLHTLYMPYMYVLCALVHMYVHVHIHVHVQCKCTVYVHVYTRTCI